MWNGCAAAMCFLHCSGGIFYMNGSLAFAELVMCLILSLELISPLITVMSHMDDTAKVKTIVGEVTEILLWEELERPAEDKETVSDHSVTLSNVTFGYHDKEVLHSVNMEIKDGTVNVLVGASRSGKSTIAKLIASLWDVKSGIIKIGGADIRNISAENYNSMVAYVSQDNYLFDDTIRENIRMGNLNATDCVVMMTTQGIIIFRIFNIHRITPSCAYSHIIICKPISAVLTNKHSVFFCEVRLR